MASLLPRSLLLALLLAAVASCAVDSGDVCNDQNQPCPGDLICIQGACRVPCDSAANACASNFTCVTGRCYQICDNFRNFCNPGLVCTAGICVKH